MSEYALKDARDQLGEIAAQVHRTREPAVITRYGRPEVVVVDIEEWQEIEAARDAADARYIAERIAADEPPVPIEEVIRRYETGHNPAAA